MSNGGRLMITRREAARSVAVTALSYSRILGANDRIGLGVIGTGGRGTYVMRLFQKNSRSEEHTSELQSLRHLVCRLLLEKKKQNNNKSKTHKRLRLRPTPACHSGAT